MAAAIQGGIFSGASWSSDFKRGLAEEFTRTACFNGHRTSLPQSSTNITPDPASKDKWGGPALRTTFLNHTDEIATMNVLHRESLEPADTAGTIKQSGSLQSRARRAEPVHG
jgi:hypothetical protein